MKISLSWLFSHIKKNPFLSFQAEFERGNFFERIGATVAEVELVEKISYPLDRIFYAVVVGGEKTQLTFVIPELDNKKVNVQARPEMAEYNVQVGEAVLLIQCTDSNDFTYLTLADLHAKKDGLVPAVWVPEGDRAGAWKKYITPFDYILTFDNKALTHRPDLWGHRGFAREICALYGLELVPDEYIFAQKAIRSFAGHAPAVAGNTIALENANPKKCKRIAGLSITHIASVGSFPDMTFKLCAVDAKPINAIVDSTNYTMYDLGQPMHAFDAAQIADQVLAVGSAKDGDTLLLLDGSHITLTAHDMVIRDGQKILSLAGIMGGKASGVTRQTNALFIEAASYVASTIRTSSLHHKIRTESSTRFEKSLDPLYNTQALMRFLHLLDIHDLPYQGAQAMLSIGDVPEEKRITFSQTFIQERIGSSVSVDHICTILSRLGFGVHQKATTAGTEFTVSVPSFRATKDITIAEDIVEEIARFIGLNNLAMQLPSRIMKPFSTKVMDVRRALKRLCAFGLQMREVSNYAFYDNQFLEKIGLRDLLAESIYAVANPVSEHWTNLVSSLVPHLFKNIEQNVHEYNRMAFFEINAVWKSINKKAYEQQSLGGIWYQKTEIDFYAHKEKVNHIFKLLELPIIWRKPLSEVEPWYHPYQAAELVCDNNIIGYAGCVRPDIIRKFSDGHAFIFEINVDVLMQATHREVVYREVSAYQPVTTDISLLVPFSVTVDTLEQTIALADARIYHVQLVDYFEKPEWTTQRAVTVRYKAVDEEKTFSRQEIEQLRAEVMRAVQALGASIR